MDGQRFVIEQADTSKGLLKRISLFLSWVDRIPNCTISFFHSEYVYLPFGYIVILPYLAVLDNP